MSQINRIAGGLIDRQKTLEFQFDGKTYQGHPGDTLASALLANGVRLMGRSFKYHRPRGPLTAGSEEPNAIVALRAGARQEPNARATVAELYDGLTARSQNHIGRLSFDLLAANDLLSPFFAAGFYYKTFMRPAWAWERLFEPAIRRAAGLGKLGDAPDAAPKTGDEILHDHTDVLIIGTGAAGLAAARRLTSSGLRIMLVERDVWPERFV